VTTAWRGDAEEGLRLQQTWKSFVNPIHTGRTGKGHMAWKRGDIPARYLALVPHNYTLSHLRLTASASFINFKYQGVHTQAKLRRAERSA